MCGHLTGSEERKLFDKDKKYSQDEIKKAAGKIAKCLALSNSDNSSEAETARRHAEALKRKYDLSEADIEAAQVREVHSFKIKKTTEQPVYLVRLMAVISKAFNCHGIYTHGCNQYMKFLGLGNKPELASYVYDVLRQQITKDRANYSKTLTRYKKINNKIKVLNAYCEAWVEQVREKIDDFASPYSAKEAAAIRAYKERNFSNLGSDTRRTSYAGISDSGLFKASVSGREAAKNAKIFQPITGNGNKADRKALPVIPKTLAQMELF
jgi:hypothetical protein